MRDVQNTTTTVNIDEHNYEPPFGDGSLFSTTPFSHNSVVSFRSDSAPTSPVGGVFVEPTAYSAKFFVSGSEYFNCVGNSVYNTKPWRTKGYSCLGYYSNAIDHAYGLTGTGSPNLPVWVQSSLDAKLLAKVNSGDWNFGQTLAEAPETIKFLYNGIRSFMTLVNAIDTANVPKLKLLLKGLGKGEVAKGTYLGPRAMRMLRKQRSLRPDLYHGSYTPGFYAERLGTVGGRYRPSPAALRKAVAKGFSSGWLAYQFALVPLWNDIYQCAQLLADGFSDPQAFTVHAEVVGPRLVPPLPNNAANAPSREQGWRSSTGAKGALSYRLADSTWYQLGQLGLTNPLYLAWQMLPLSFVVDWFLTIGKFLESLKQPSGLTFAGGWSTKFSSWSLQREYLPLNHVQYHYGQKPKVMARSFAFRRDLYISFPIVTPYFRGFTNLSQGQLLSLAALTVQRT